MKDCKRLILIGDPKQLPATVFSRLSQNQKYDQSLFFRLQTSGYPVHLLQVFRSFLFLNVVNFLLRFNTECIQTFLLLFLKDSINQNSWIMRTL